MNTFDASTSQRPQPARDNRSAAQRRYRKKEEDGFFQLREALKKVAKDDPRTRQDILRKASCELRRLADENHLLSQQKALIEACSSPQSPSCGGVIYEDPVEWQWSHDSTEARNMRSDMTRRNVFDAAMLPNTSMPTAQNYEWFTQLYDANMVQDSSQLNHPWASHAGESGNFAPRPHSGSEYYARCANCQHYARCANCQHRG